MYAEKRAYAAIRKEADSGREWIDVSTIAPLRELVATKTNIPAWERDNPVIRIVRISIRELED